MWASEKPKDDVPGGYLPPPPTPEINPVIPEKEKDVPLEVCDSILEKIRREEDEEKKRGGDKPTAH